VSELPTVQVLPSAEGAAQPVFYYDLADPLCYLAAEQIMAALPVVPEWEPVHAAEIREAPPEMDLEWLARQVRELGLQPLQWPEGWPPDSRAAMLAATYAKRIGRAVAFSLAAFRQAFAGGRDLADPDTILIAGAACEMHPAALLKGMEMRAVAVALGEATHRARRAGARSLPAIQVGDRIFAGPDAVGGAREALG
jgi:2-hydroxychromene-2-carboxylate isomerase